MSSHQRLVFSILDFLNSECESRVEGCEKDERESLEVVMECLERVYNVSLNNQSDVFKFKVEKSLTEIFESATQYKERLPTDEEKGRAEDHKTQGNNLMKEGKCDEAIECYNKAVELDWTNAVYLCNRAAAFSKLGKHEEAIKDCQKSLELDPRYSKAYGRMGTAFMALEKYEEARQSFDKAKQLDPGNNLYTTNLRNAEDKLRETKEKPSSASQGTGGGPANLMSSLFSNPGIMNMASQFMANPQMQQMMTNMMSGFGGMTGDDHSAGHHPPPEPAGAQPAGGGPAGGHPAGGQPGSEGTTTPEANPGTGGPGEAMGAGGYPNIFQFATQMAQQLEQTNPELITSLRQTMQGGRGQNTEPNENTEDPDQNAKE